MITPPSHMRLESDSHDQQPESSQSVTRGGPDTALSAWVVKQQEDREDTLVVQSLWFPRHPDIQSDVWATPPPRHVTSC